MFVCVIDCYVNSNSYDCFVLKVVVERLDPDELRSLLKSGKLDVNKRDVRDGMNLLHHASSKGNLMVVTSIIP